MEVATSIVKVEGGLKDGSVEAIKLVEGTFGCVNESIRVSGKGKYKSYHSWLVKSKLCLYLEERDC